jgi:glycine cleavage system protein P-like pyridoxal-binding family
MVERPAPVMEFKHMSCVHRVFLGTRQLGDVVRMMHSATDLNLNALVYASPLCSCTSAMSPTSVTTEAEAMAWLVEHFAQHHPDKPALPNVGFDGSIAEAVEP